VTRSQKCLHFWAVTLLLRTIPSKHDRGHLGAHLHRSKRAGAHKGGRLAPEIDLRELRDFTNVQKESGDEYGGDPVGDGDEMGGCEDCMKERRTGI